MVTRDRIFVALDGLGRTGACNLVAKLTNLNAYIGALAGFKIHDLWNQYGPSVLNDLECAGAGGYVWVDLKLHDTPETIRLCASAVKEHKVGYLTVHALGGIEMMKKAVEAGPKVIAVTILTSLSESEVRMRFRRPVHDVVVELAFEAKRAGVWGVVCSPHEVGVLASNPDLKGLRFITPGIRLAGKDAADTNQKRVHTPTVAFESGAHYIVVGSEITKAADPTSVLAKIVDEIDRIPDEEGASQ